MRLSILLTAATAVSALTLPPHYKRHEGHDEDDTPDDSASTHLPHNDHPHMSSNSSEMEPSPASMNGGHHSHGAPILAHPEKLEPQQLAYWTAYDPTNFFNTETPGQALLTWHIILVVTGWVAVYPISAMLSLAESGLYLPLQTVQVVMVILASLAIAMYGTSPEVEKMYPGAIYGKFTVIVLLLTVAHYLAAILTALAYKGSSKVDTLRNQPESFQLQSYHRVSDSDSDHTLNGVASSSSNASDQQQDQAEPKISDETPVPYYGDDECAEGESSSSLLHNNEDKWVSQLMANSHVSSAVKRFGSMANFVHSWLRGLLFLVGFAYLVCGIVTGSRMGMGRNVFNILAHFIKGGVFTVLGLFTFARYVGVFVDKGWAWNLNQEQVNSVRMLQTRSRANSRSRRRSTRSSSAVGTAPVTSNSTVLIKKVFSNITGALAFLKPQSFTFEFLESALILAYGVPNIFLEHLASKDGHWTPADLQHASIAFMFIGGGLSGVLLESGLVRKLLMSKTYPISFNPFPALTIFWTGILMSQHAQALPLSTAIHTQWGYLLSIGAVFRGITYLQFMIVYSQALSRTDSGAEMNFDQLTLPSRPFTEIVASFCLISGGLVFMQSNRETVEALVYRGFDSMFTLNVTVGITSFIMAWELVVLAIKGWAIRRKTAV